MDQKAPRTGCEAAPPARCLPAIALALAVALLAAPAGAEDWIYTVRPGDNLWDLAREFMQPTIPLDRLQEYNQVTDPHAVPAGSTLLFPIAWLRIQPAKARVVAVHGEVLGQYAASPSSFAVENNLELDIGVTLTTGEDSNLTLQLADGSRLLVQSDSSLTLDTVSAYGTTGMVDTGMRLQRGRVSGQVTRERGSATRFVIETPNATTSVRGTDFRVASDSAVRTLAEVLSGDLAVRGELQDMTVDAGFGVLVVTGEAPTPPVPLLPAPNLERLPTAFDRVPLSFSWPPLNEGPVAGYRVQIAPDRRFETLLYDELVDEPRASLTDLPDGELVLRLRALDENRMEGRDALHDFTLKARPEPPFRIDPAEGSTVRDARPRFTWTDSEEAVAYRFQLAREERFDEPILDLENLAGTRARPQQALRPGVYSWRVSARDAQGDWGPWSDPQEFSFEPQPPRPEGVALERKGRSLTVHWRSAGPGYRYRVQLSQHADFSDVEIELDLETTEVSVPRPRRGTWYLRAQAIESDGHAGPFSPVQSVEVRCRGCTIAKIATGTIVVVILVAL